MSRPRSQDYCGFEGFTADHAHVEDRDTWTGLYDHNGQELHRPKEPIGFQPHRWDAKANDRKSMRTRKR